MKRVLERWEEWLRGHRFASSAILVVIALVVFGKSLSNGFVYDDIVQILQNPFIRNAHLWKRIFTGSVWSFVGLSGDYYRPLQEFSWWSLYRLDGADYALFHLLQLLLFVAAVWVVYRLGLELLENDLAAFAGALLWAVHPIHVEAVAWISALGDVGAGLFYLLGMWLFLRAQKRTSGRWTHHAIAAFCFFTALFFKEMALSFPLVLLAYGFFFPQQTSWPKRAAQYAPYLLALGAYIAIRHAAVGSLTLASKPWKLSGRVLLAAVGLLGQNTQLFFWPAHLNPARTFDLGQSLRSPWPWAMILAALVALWYRRSQPTLGFLVLWWPLTLAPCLDYRQLSWPLVADRFSFIPSVGLCLIIAYLAVVWLPKRLRSASALQYALIALALLGSVWGVLTEQDIPNWRSYETLVAVSARQAPDSPLVHMTKAWELQYRAGDLDGAAREFEIAMRLNASSFRPIFNLSYNAYIGLGNIALLKGSREEAMNYFRRAITLWPQMSSAYHSVGAVYFANGDYSQAAGNFSTAVRYDGQDLIGRFYLGTCLMKLGEYRKAAEQFHAARETDPSYFEAYAAEAHALEVSGDAAGAARIRALMPNP